MMKISVCRIHYYSTLPRAGEHAARNDINIDASDIGIRNIQRPDQTKIFDNADERWFLEIVVRGCEASVRFSRAHVRKQ
jgi:hypothetical protein